MANGDVTLIMKGSMNGANVKTYLVEVNGTTGITLKTGFSKILGAFATWAEDIGATGHVIELAKSGGTLTITASGAITKDAHLVVFGLT